MIVPVYSIPESYLRKAIESAQRQTLHDIEIILIDDGSPDDSGAICDAYAQQDQRIRVLHKENGGVSAARNDGIKAVRGQWINFLDPDDWMPEDALEKMVQTAQQNQSDIVVGGLQVFYEDTPGPQMGFLEKVQVLDESRKNDYTFNLICRHFEQRVRGRKDFGENYQGAPWGKLFAKKLLQEQNLFFCEGLHPYEDTLFNVCAAFRAARVVLMDCCVYFYRINPGSVTVKFKPTWIQNNLLYISRIERTLQENGFNEKDKLICDVFHGCIVEKIASLLLVYFFHADNPKSRRQVYCELSEFSQNAYVQRALRDRHNPFYTQKQQIILWCLRNRMYFLLEILAFLKTKSRN